MKSKKLEYILMITALLIILLFSIRLFSEKQLDDVSPGIPCSQELLEKADVFYVIPKFNNESIAENTSFCKQILGMNKTLALHGVYHTYKEFSAERDEAYVDESIRIFEECFNKTPERFKPPQLALSKNNAEIIKKKMRIDRYLDLIFHKVYHCNDSDKYFRNKRISMFDILETIFSKKV